MKAKNCDVVNNVNNELDEKNSDAKNSFNDE